MDTIKNEEVFERSKIERSWLVEWIRERMRFIYYLLIKEQNADKLILVYPLLDTRYRDNNFFMCLCAYIEALYRNGFGIIKLNFAVFTSSQVNELSTFEIFYCINLLQPLN